MFHYTIEWISPLYHYYRPSSPTPKHHHVSTYNNIADDKVDVSLIKDADETDANLAKGKPRHNFDEDKRIGAHSRGLRRASRVQQTFQMALPPAPTPQNTITHNVVPTSSINQH
ncbi:hypothetical protein F5Y05DRAFT_180379 [Hypoxylon sp. FL0543]|nr:hypothetical protein F5Y05DRAFT_180379 [Hypoxylon sp. FL0543]